VSPKNKSQSYRVPVYAVFRATNCIKIVFEVPSRCTFLNGSEATMGNSTDSGTLQAKSKCKIPICADEATESISYAARRHTGREKLRVTINLWPRISVIDMEIASVCKSSITSIAEFGL